MKTRPLTLTLIAVSILTLHAGAQTAAAWTFPGSVTPTTKGANITASNTTGGPDVGSLAFSGADFFGQDGWPSGAIDLNAYLQVTITPNSGFYLALNSISINLRRSTTGSSGAGPNNWSLRSSVDGFATDLMTGTLTGSYQTFSLTLPAAFQVQGGIVTFRIYGFNQVTSSGGSNRFVTNNITIQGQAMPGVLAIQSIDLKAQAAAHSVDLQYQALGFPDGTEFTLQRSTDGAGFDAIGQLQDSSFVDNSVPAAKVFYRVEAQSPDGETYFSPIVVVTMATGATGAETAIRAVIPQGNMVKTLLHVERVGTYQLSIRSIDGRPLYSQELSGQTGDIPIDMAFGAKQHGVYVLTLAGNGKISSREFLY